MRDEANGLEGPRYLLPDEPGRANEPGPSEPQAPSGASTAPRAADVSVGDWVLATAGMHRGQRGQVAYILPASLEYARVRLEEGERTIPIRFLQRLECGESPPSEGSG